MHPIIVVGLLCVYSTRTSTSDVTNFTGNTKQTLHNMDDESRDVSLRLWDVLDRVGVSERMRQLRRNACIKMEIQVTITSSMVGSHKSGYIFGSYIEGTTTPGMHSDLDMVHCDESLPVIAHIDQASPGQQSLLPVSDHHTRPGYVKLQLVNDGIPLTIHNFITEGPRLGNDTMGRVCYKHHYTNESDIHTERGGPADTIIVPGAIEADYVYAVRSRTFPRDAVESLLKCTRIGWLTREDVYEMIKYGCLYVGVGHPSSTEKEYEWRVSFSLQERKLMFRLNPTQHKCYSLLKFIKIMLTSIPDIGKSITSYHCKTCLFRVITKTQLEQWTPVNLIKCTFECLTELLQCLCNGDCPNFFIPTNNMFDRRVNGDVKYRLIHYLRGMLSEGFPVFYRIQSDNIGQALRGHTNWYISMERSLCNAIYSLYINACNSILSIYLEIVKHMKGYANAESTRFLFQQLCYLSSVRTITEHTPDETKAAIREFEPILHRIYATHLVSLAFSTDVHESKHRLFQTSARHLKHVMPWHLMSGRLLYATILYRQGNSDTCSNILERIEQNLHEIVQTVCGCYTYATYNTYLEQIFLLSRNPDPQSMMESSVAACMIFLPSHTEITPTALQYESYRSVATPPGSRRRLRDAWFDLAVVDSKVYFYFLQYLVYSRLNRAAARRRATDNLLKQLLHDVNLGHRETGYNLLGWIHSQEGHIEAAARCFILSWMIRPHHNAAKWHMLILIYRQHAARQ